jgi:hypothetical protein
VPAKSKLKSALDAIAHAKKSLNRAKNDIDDDYDIYMALKNLDDAEDEIKQALGELKGLSAS